MIKGAFGSGTASPIAPLLWQGGYPHNPDELIQYGFNTIVLAACELQPSDDYTLDSVFPKGLKIICAPLRDEVDVRPHEIDLAIQAANSVLRELHLGNTVLTTCVMGLNRSGFINGLVLAAMYGISGKEAVQRIRAARKGALTNPTFVDYIEKIPARFS